MEACDDDSNSGRSGTWTRGIAAAQHKTVEQVAVESLRSLFDEASSPEFVLRAVRELPHPSAAAVDELEAAIAAARLPVRDQGAFDR
jgi:hypothetical protein